MKYDEPIKSEYLSYRDVANACVDIAHGSKKAHKAFSDSKIKKKYTVIVDIADELEKAIQSGDTKKVEKLMEKFSSTIERYKGMKTKIDISEQREHNNEAEYTLTRLFEEKGNISKLGIIWAYAKENVKKELEERKADIADKKREEHYAVLSEKAAKKREEQLIEENKRKRREDTDISIDRANAMSRFETETRGQVENEKDAAMKMYGDSDSGRAYTEIKKAKDSIPEYLQK